MGSLRILVLCAVFGALAASSASSTPPACTVTLQPGQSIQSAIDRASDGAVICLTSGQWKENITVAKSITLLGESPQATSIQGNIANLPVLQINAPTNGISVIVENLSLDGAVGYPDGSGVLVEGKAKVRITRCSAIDNRMYGIVLRNGAEAEIIQCYVARNTDGITLHDSSTAAITDCEVTCNSRDGITLQEATRATISSTKPVASPDPAVQPHCHIHANQGCGVRVSDEAEVTLKDCSIDNNEEEGVAVEHNAHVALAGGMVYGNGDDGIALFDSSRGVISESRVIGNGRGVFAGNGILLSGTAQATIRGCRLENNGRYGVAIHERPCADTNARFTGYLTGQDNLLTGNDAGATCPTDLAQFLTTRGGGSFYPITVQRNQPIQPVIDRVPPGSAIKLEGMAEWHENITIAKSLTLIGEATLVAAAKGPVIKVESTERDIYVELLGLRVSGASPVDVFDMKERVGGILVSGKAHLSARECWITENDTFGIRVDSSQLSLVNCNVSGNSLAGVVLGTGAKGEIIGSRVRENNDAGVRLFSNAECTIDDSEISANSGDGITLWDQSRLLLLDSRVLGNAQMGVAVWQSSQARMEGNSIAGNSGYGVALVAKPYFGWVNDPFLGRVTGAANAVPDVGQEGANKGGAVYPSQELGFLMSATAGELDQRE